MTNLLEAMARGISVIMTKRAALEFKLVQAGFGLYVDPGNESDLQTSCNLIFSHPDQDPAMCYRGRNLVEGHFNIEHLGAKFAVQFRRLLGDSSEPVVP